MEVKFISERRYGWTREQIAYASTGRNRETGKLTLGVSMRNRHNGMVRFEFDLWRLSCDLNTRAIERLQSHWLVLNGATPPKKLTRMEQHFGRTFIQFDTMAEQADDWREFLSEVLTDRASYIDTRMCRLEIVAGRSQSDKGVNQPEL